MRETYIFDKRRYKKWFIKYGIILALTLPILIIFNLLVNDIINNFAVVVFLDVVIALTLVFCFSIVYNKLKEKKEQKTLDRLRVEKIREKQLQNRENQLKENERKKQKQSSKKPRKRNNSTLKLD